MSNQEVVVVGQTAAEEKRVSYFEEEEQRMEQLKKKHEKWFEHREILLNRRELSSGDLKALVKFAEHFRLQFNIQENLAKSGWVDRHGVMISISDPTF
jgi:hypothetical protein